ncbi:hypothetical protein FA95DRAFT_1607763 [Auriscalpium vulgare]|uniref:Uncharacterized protein n=1 Tax=Auriscalpium vulgare TaxID=40419 RepID=A0ACB8RP23_9AGAM|nr:hypothetical protein FA95DRAFT_1607763 [Auriscalpium vulgare]
MVRLSQLLVAFVAIAAASAMPVQKRSAEDSVTLAARACESGSLHECATALEALHAGDLISDLSPVEARHSEKKSKSKSKGVLSALKSTLGTDTSGSLKEGTGSSGPVGGVPIQGVTEHSPTLNDAALARRLFLGTLPIVGAHAIESLHPVHHAHHAHSKATPDAAPARRVFDPIPEFPQPAHHSHHAHTKATHNPVAALARRLLLGSLPVALPQPIHHAHHAHVHTKATPNTIAELARRLFELEDRHSGKKSKSKLQSQSKPQFTASSLGLGETVPTALEARHSRKKSKSQSEPQSSASITGASATVGEPVPFTNHVLRSLLLDLVPIQGDTHPDPALTEALARRLFDLEARHSRKKSKSQSKPASITGGTLGLGAPVPISGVTRHDTALNAEALP